MSERSENPSTKANYSDLFERMRDVILLLNPVDYTLIEANPAFELSVGADLAQIQNRCVLDWVAPSERATLEKSLRISMRRHHPRATELDWKLAGTRAQTIELLSGPLELKEGLSVLQLIVRDITEKKAADRKLQELLVALQSANEKLEALSTTDEMTGLNNYRSFKKQMDAEFNRYSRYKTPFSLIFFDIDHFKKYNDRNGHPAGDDLLRGFAKLLKTGVRVTDFPARYGGEEFVVLCPETEPADAMILADRLRASLQNANLPFAEFQPLGYASASVGVSGCPTTAATIEEVLELADQALYYSKATGRNRVTQAKMHPPLTDEMKAKKAA